MKLLHIVLCLGVVTLLVWLNRAGVGETAAAYGGLTWVGWASLGVIGFVLFVLVLAKDSTRALGLFRLSDDSEAPPAKVRVLNEAELRELGLDKYRGPSYPHPVIFPDRCIGCQACVDACPHDVLAIVDGRAASVAPDLCMEDTACQAECPVNPKACIIINTAKDVRSMPIPTRDGSTYETNVRGCYIIGEVSGVPLIKNAVKEGAEVIRHIAAELSALPRNDVDYDVAIIGVGPGGASAAATAVDSNLKYVAIEQTNVLSTIDLYPKGKYIFFKPDTNDWEGGIPTIGLGLTKAKYGAATTDENAPIYEALGPEFLSDVRTAARVLHQEVLTHVPAELRDEVEAKLAEKIEKELKDRIAQLLRSHGSGDWAGLYREHVAGDKAGVYERLALDVADQMQTKVPGDQRENILAVWLATLREKGVRVNEQERCATVTRSDSDDSFIIETEKGDDKVKNTYRARRVVISIGLRGAPNKLRLPNEDMRITLDGREQQKVLYVLSNPMDFRGKNIVVVGGGNVAVEAAVDLVAVREGNAIRPREAADMNRVTVLVRDNLAPTVKFANKFQLYQCAEDGLLDLRFGLAIKEMRENELVLEDVATKRIVETIPSELVFALIGGERPNRFLESIGITIK